MSANYKQMVRRHLSKRRTKPQKVGLFTKVSSARVYWFVRVAAKILAHTKMCSTHAMHQVVGGNSAEGFSFSLGSPGVFCWTFLEVRYGIMHSKTITEVVLAIQSSTVIILLEFKALRTRRIVTVLLYTWS